MTLHALLADVIWDLEKAGQTVLASRILEDSRGKVLAALVEAAVRIDDFLENGYTKEEMKMVHETRKILEDDSIRITATTVRVPVYIGHSEAINIETEKKIPANEARAILSAAPGVIVYDDPARDIYPVPLNVAGKDEVFVGRIREDESIPNGLNLWVVADNLRKGAATNAIQIAEILTK